MSLYSEWHEKLEKNRENGTDEAFINNYISAETEAYRSILESGDTQISGKLSELAEAYQMDNVTFMGFLDGINSSLENDLDLESLEPDSEITLSINLEKLFYNMLEAKAEWLMVWRNGTAALLRRSARKFAENSTKITAP